MQGVEGPQGAKGDTGPVGPAGAQGPPGDSASASSISLQDYSDDAEAVARGVPRWGLYRKGDALQMNTQTTPYTYDLGTRAGHMIFQDVTWTPDPSVGMSDPAVASPAVVTVEFWVYARTGDTPAFATLRQVAASNTPAARFDYLTIGLSGGGRPQFRTAGGVVGIDVAFPLGQWTHVAVSLDYRNAAASRSALSVDPPITACWWTNGFYRGAVVLPLAYPLGRCDLCLGGEVVTPSTRTSYGNNLNGIIGSVRVREGMWSEQGTTSNPPNGFVPSKNLDWDNDVSFQLVGPLAAGVT